MEMPDTSSQQIAEYAMALDLCSQLTLVLDEDAVQHRILEIFSLLFAPKCIIFRVMEQDILRSTLIWPEERSAPGWTAEFPAPDSGRPDARRGVPDTIPGGFRVAIPFKEEIVGIIEVHGIAFPEYQERYLSLALAIAGVCGLSLVNARTHRKLEAALIDLRHEHDQTLRLDEELRLMNEELEERVRIRTRDLEMTARNLAEEVNQRKAAEQVIRSQLDEKSLLVRELDHRVKNNLQIISSMLSIQSHKVTDPSLQLVLSESRNRIRTISKIHEMVFAARDFSHIDINGFIRQIPSTLFTLYQVPPQKIAVNLELQDIFVDINTAIPLGLILNELFANSIKHAFPGARTGTISLKAEEEDMGLVLCYCDNGIGLPAGYDWENPDRVGQILINGLVQQLDGTIEKLPKDGTAFRIRLPRKPAGSCAMRGTYNELPSP
ncbi:MAG: hypothetical protein GYA23_03680 [Methanomicrobiales archaeon]|nr:hypothetical protein [Methanomicrobiales archaeon]